jgi:hypothetical protein
MCILTSSKVSERSTQIAEVPNNFVSGTVQAGEVRGRVAALAREESIVVGKTLQSAGLDPTQRCWSSVWRDALSSIDKTRQTQAGPPFRRRATHAFEANMSTSIATSGLCDAIDLSPP